MEQKIKQDIPLGKNIRSIRKQKKLTQMDVVQMCIRDSVSAAPFSAKIGPSPSLSVRMIFAASTLFLLLQPRLVHPRSELGAGIRRIPVLPARHPFDL